MLHFHDSFLKIFAFGAINKLTADVLEIFFIKWSDMVDECYDRGSTFRLK